MERCFVLGDMGTFGDKLPAAILFEDKFPTLLLPDVFSRRELLRCDRGTDVDEIELFTVFTFDSDKAKSFLTASGECVPFLRYKKIPIEIYIQNLNIYIYFNMHNLFKES